MRRRKSQKQKKAREALEAERVRAERGKKK